MSYFKLYYHLVFRTYRSQRTIAENHEQELYRYILGYCRQHHICLIRINSLPDHIHMFVSTGPNICPADLL
ncbi:MAG: transposase [Prevotella sp.]